MGAQVDDSWTAVFDAAPDAVLHVDQNHPSASDGNPGTPDLPLKTIGRGAELAVANKGAGTSTQILVSSAVYRESVNLRWKRSAAYIVLEGTGPGVVISGSDVFDNWTLVGGNIWETPWTMGWGPLPVPGGWPATFGDLLYRREMVFDEGELLRPVLAYGDLEIGTFFVDDAAEKLYVWPHNDLDFMEVAMRERVLWVQDIDYVKTKNITVQHHAPADVQQYALNVLQLDHVLIEDCIAVDNSMGGIGFYDCADVVVRNIAAQRAGTIGVGSSEIKDSIFDGVSVSENNWRGHLADFYDWASGGSKILRQHNVIHRNYKCAENLATGFWVDFDSVDVSLESIECHSNLKDNLWLEAIQGPIEVVGALLWGSDEYGLNATNVINLSLRDVHAFNNALGQIAIGGATAGRDVTNWETGEVVSCVPGVNWTMEGVFLHGPLPLLEGYQHNPGQGIDGSWENMPGLVARGVHFFKRE